MRRGTLSPLAALLLAALPLRAQTPRPLTVDWIYGEEATAAARLPKFAWTTADDVLILDERAAPDRRTIERIRAKTGQRSAAVDAAAALASLRAISPEDTPASLAWPEALDPAGTTAIYVLGDDLYALDLAASRFSRLTTTDAKETLPRFSPDGRKLAFVRGNDLYVSTRSKLAEP